MRTTIDLDDDVLAAVDRRMHERGIGRSRAVNDLVRSALAAPAPDPGREYQPQTYALGIRVDVSNIADVLEHLDSLEAEERSVPREPGPTRRAG